MKSLVLVSLFLMNLVWTSLVVAKPDEPPKPDAPSYVNAHTEADPPQETLVQELMFQIPEVLICEGYGQNPSKRAGLGAMQFVFEVNQVLDCDTHAKACDVEMTVTEYLFPKKYDLDDLGSARVLKAAKKDIKSKVKAAYTLGDNWILSLKDYQPRFDGKKLAQTVPKPKVQSFLPFSWDLKRLDNMLRSYASLNTYSDIADKGEKLKYRESYRYILFEQCYTL